MRGLLLRITLIVIGGLFCLAGVGLVVPESGLKAFAGWFAGAEDVKEFWPTAPLFGYVFRASLVAYLWIGVVLLVAAWDPTRHKVQIDIAIGGLLLMTIVCLITGMANRLPALWYLGDTFFSLVAAVLLVVFRPRRPKG